MAGFILNTGGRYDPATNSWRATSVGGGTPSARNFHTAVWSGSRMIVWGGLSGQPEPTRTFNDGAMYDPIDDSWQQTSMGADVPEARCVHEAVWTGTEMLVWGGGKYDPWDFVHLDDGAALDPSTGTWRPIGDSGGSPTARGSFVSIWSGSEMIIWGGAPWGLNSGGRYNLATDSWRPTRQIGAPQPRYNSAAIWTGEWMIVWGGGPEMVTGTGGLYCVCSLPPIGIVSLTASKPTPPVVRLTWSPAVGVRDYDLVQGNLQSLHDTQGRFDLSTTACTANETSLTEWDDAAVPQPGDGTWYLVRPVGCGGAGTYDSGALSQQGARDDEIEASGVGCP